MSIEKMPEGLNNLKSLGKVQSDQHRGHIIAQAANLMKEMAEALELATTELIGFIDSGDYYDKAKKVEEVLKKFKEWK